MAKEKSSSFFPWWLSSTIWLDSLIELPFCGKKHRETIVVCQARKPRRSFIESADTKCEDVVISDSILRFKYTCQIRLTDSISFYYNLQTQVVSFLAYRFFPIIVERESHLLLTHTSGIEKVWANELSHQKKIDMISYFYLELASPIPMNRDVVLLKLRTLQRFTEKGSPKS